jgi:hypothetical protein
MYLVQALCLVGYEHLSEREEEDEQPKSRGTLTSTQRSPLRIIAKETPIANSGIAKVTGYWTRVYPAPPRALGIIMQRACVATNPSKYYPIRSKRYSDCDSEGRGFKPRRLPSS